MVAVGSLFGKFAFQDFVGVGDGDVVVINEDWWLVLVVPLLCLLGFLCSGPGRCPGTNFQVSQPPHGTPFRRHLK